MYLLLLFFLFSGSLGLKTAAPIWVTSEYFQANNEDIISTQTTSNVTPTYTFTFSRQFSGMPYLGYGVKTYQGGDYFGPEQFFVDRVTLTSTFFRVLVQIVGSTYIWVLNVPYIAIDPLFPHRVASFDNVPVNYTDGFLAIFDTPSPTIQTYSNTINFTQQAGDQSFNTFEQPLSRNKIILLTSSFYISGNNQNWDALPSELNPLNLRISTNIVSSSEYQIVVSFGVRAQLTKLHFSQIIIDTLDILNSLKYSVQYYTVDVYPEGGFYPVPREFVDNLIVGFTDFSSQRTRCIFHTTYSMQQIDGQFGIYVPVRIATFKDGTISNTTIYRLRYSIFYLKTWYCPPQTSFFDQSTQLCTQCPIGGCLVCETLTQCRQYQIVQITNLTVVKSGCNQINLTLILPSSSFSLDQMNNKAKFVNINVSSVQYIITDNLYNISFVYTSSVSQVIQFQLPNFQIVQFNNNLMIPSVVYQDDECLHLETAKNLFIAAESISYAILLLSIVANCKIIGLQMMALLQFAYFNLADNTFWNVYLAPLAEFSHLNGFNTPIIEQNASVPHNIEEMSINTQFLNNFNVMLFLLLGQVFVGFILMAISFFILPENKVLKKYSHKLVKQGFITLILFNALNIAFSAGIHWKYSEHASILSSCFLYLSIALLFASAICMELVSKKGYGQYKQKFKKDWVCSLYICLQILYLSSLGVYMAMQNQFEQGTIIIIGFSGFFALYFYLNLPFKDYYMNYRAGIILITHMVILFVTNYYRSMKSTTHIEIKAHIHTPAIIQITLLYISLTVSVVCLSYEIFLKLKRCMKYSHKNQVANTVNTKNALQQQSNIIFFTQ